MIIYFLQSQHELSLSLRISMVNFNMSFKSPCHDNIFLAITTRTFPFQKNLLQPKRELLLFQRVVALHSSVQTNYGGDAGFEADPICPHDRFEACIENTNNNNKSRSERRHGQLGGSSNRSLGIWQGTHSGLSGKACQAAQKPRKFAKILDTVIFFCHLHPQKVSVSNNFPHLSQINLFRCSGTMRSTLA